MATGFDYEFLTVEQRGTYCVLTMNRAEKRNALNETMRSEFLDFLHQADDLFHVVILTGSGNSFSSGLDLKEATPEKSSREMWQIAHGIYGSACIFIAAVNGFARGGGLTMVNASDIALAHPEATFGMPEIGFGIYATVAGPTTQLATPKKVAAKMILTGQSISADEAARSFLINTVVGEDRLMEEADILAKHISSLNKSTLAAAKRGLNAFPFDQAMREQGEKLTQDLNRQIRTDSR